MIVVLQTPCYSEKFNDMHFIVCINLQLGYIRLLGLIWKVWGKTRVPSSLLKNHPSFGCKQILSPRAREHSFYWFIFSFSHLVMSKHSYLSHRLFRNFQYCSQYKLFFIHACKNISWIFKLDIDRHDIIFKT